MSLLKSIRELLGIKTQKQVIIERLLQENKITPREAIVLMEGGINLAVRVGKVDISSGAKVFVGEDNETTSQ